jgi:NADPH:quinone reductase-like Zn-dependent oxidoreductase
MRAAVLTEFGKPLEVRQVPDPVLGGGEAVVEVLATSVLPYAAEIFSGARRYPLEPPVVPGLGGVCRVVRLGPDATKLAAGDLVWVDPLREYGRIVLMGGVGMLGGDDLALPYPWIMRNSVTLRGQWMFQRPANVGMIRLAASGLLDLAHEQVTAFALDEVNEAVAHAAAHPGPFDRTVLNPAAG